MDFDSIPRIEKMSEKLQKFGWQAVPVDGFLPPAVFMELQSMSVLPIASAIRTIDHILYTPAPDIVHEAAGHAPMLINRDFANYLRRYAHVAKKTIMSSKDLEQYIAIRELSDKKEDPPQYTSGNCRLYCPSGKDQSKYFSCFGSGPNWPHELVDRRIRSYWRYESSQNFWSGTFIFCGRS